MKPIASLAVTVMMVAACSQAEPQLQDTYIVISDNALNATAPLRKQFDCLPKEAAFIAAHRGVSKGKGLAENSRSSLQSLIDHGTLIAEVDVAGLKDGTHILFHDGVWEEKTTGKGAVAASSWTDAGKILLYDTDGKLTADRPIRLSDALTLAKDRLYLEIDFKSSAKYGAVIDAIRKADMSDRVILIAYTDNQARKLAEMAPEMMLSVGVSEQGGIQGLEQKGVKRENMAAWIGRGPYDPPVIDRLENAGLPILAWPGRNYVDETAAPATVIVTDYASDYDPVVGLTSENQKSYVTCLSGQ